MSGDSPMSIAADGRGGRGRRLRLWPPGMRPAKVPRGRVGMAARAVLVAEILLSYVELLRLLRRGDLSRMVRAARRAHLRVDWALPLPEEHRVARRLGRIVYRVVESLPTDKRCLITSLVLVRVLSHRSIGARLVIGVQSEGGFAAHAWVEHAGVPILPDGNFQRLMDL